MESLQHIVLAGSSQEESEDQQEVSYDTIAEDEGDLNEQEEDEETLELEELQAHLHKVC